MTRAAMLLLPLLFLAACAGDDGSANSCGPLPDSCQCDVSDCGTASCQKPCICSGGQWQPSVCEAGTPDAGQSCPNAIASDENCGACVKNWGSGASYCAASCSADIDCAGMTSAWGSEPLVCHPDGYCTGTCTTSADCYLGDNVDYSCDDGRCTVCINCY